MACKVADRSERGSTGILVAFWTFFISVTGIKFSIWTEDKIRPAYRASPVTGLIWRGPEKELWNPGLGLAKYMYKYGQTLL